MAKSFTSKAELL